MSDRNLKKSSRVDAFLKELSPEGLEQELRRYQKVFHGCIDIKDLLHIKEIQAIALIAGDINSLHGSTTNQSGKMKNDMEDSSIKDKLDCILDAITDLTETLVMIS